MVNPNFWKKKNVFLTGHTGFKGSWLSFWLSSMGANVWGYALEPNQSPSLFNILNVDSYLTGSTISDIRDLSRLTIEIRKISPDIIIHMAAQPLVRESYLNPVDTYSTNVMGTVNILEAVRRSDSVRSVVIVTTDKCYENKEWLWPYKEIDPMGGYDPYSSSKGCAELVTQAYQRSFFQKNEKNLCGVATARAGNVIGGGDWSKDRLIPDMFRALKNKKAIEVRYPLAIRPWQHVLEPLYGYLLLAEALYEKPGDYSTAWNFGPADSDCRPVQNVIDLFIAKWGSGSRVESTDVQPHEAHTLKLDCSKANRLLGWQPRWTIEDALDRIVEWHKDFESNKDMREVSKEQIQGYMKKWVDDELSK